MLSVAVSTRPARLCLVLTSGVTLAVAACRSVAPPARDDVERNAIVLELAVCRAIETRDAARLTALLAPGFEHHAISGAVSDREQFIRGATQAPGSTLSVRCDELAVERLSEDALVITGRQRSLVRLAGGTVSADEQRFVDRAAHRDGRWQLVSSQSFEAKR